MVLRYPTVLECGDMRLKHIARNIRYVLSEVIATPNRVRNIGCDAAASLKLLKDLKRTATMLVALPYPATYSLTAINVRGEAVCFGDLFWLQPGASKQVKIAHFEDLFRVEIRSTGCLIRHCIIGPHWQSRDLNAAVIANKPLRTSETLSFELASLKPTGANER